MRALLDGVRDGTTSTDEAFDRLSELPVRDLGFARVDLHRELRQGAPEVILAEGKTPAEAQQYLYDLFKNVPVQDDSARNALATFSGGKGDVLLSYENEAILAQAKGEDVDYVVPDQTIKIETVAAVTKSAPPAAQKWLDWLYTPEAQKIFADNGYRPVVSGVTGKYDFPTPPQEFTIDDLGGWSKVKDQFFDDQKGIMAKVEQSIGVSTTG